MRKLDDIEVLGDYRDVRNIDIIGDLKKFGGKYPFDLYPDFPADVRIIRGTEMACREGCVNNPLAVLQTLAKDYAGRGGWTLVMGKGFDRERDRLPSRARCSSRATAPSRRSRRACCGGSGRGACT